MSRSRLLQYPRIAGESRLKRLAVTLIILLPLNALAYEFTDAKITDDDGVFQIRISAIIAAPAEYIRNVLTDYSHLYRLSPSIIENEVLPSSTRDEKHIRTLLLFCTSVFCREAERVDTVRVLDSGIIQAEIIPHLSEFKSGKASWTIIPRNDQTHVVYQAYLEPDFFIPPMLGTKLIMDNLHAEFKTTFIRMERIASFNAERDWNEDLKLTAAVKTEDAPCRDKLSVNLQ